MPRLSWRYWRNIALVGVSGVAIVIVAVALYIVALASQAAQTALTPPRIPVTQTPGEMGIEAYTNVTFTTVDNINLHGWYVAPASENATVIILLHGYASNRQSLLPEARILTQHGYGVLLFDFRGHGESDAALVTLGDHEQRDLAAAIEWAVNQPRVRRLGAIGFSMGGAVLAQVAATDSRVGAVVIEATFPTLGEELHYRARQFGWLSQLPALYVMRQAGIGLDRVRPVDVLCAISPRRVLLIYGSADAFVPPGTAQAMQEAACGSADLWIVPGATHQNFTEAVPAEYAARLLDFFGQ
jgi:alpha-beta hydrolase superfamily lysophospholipase